MEIDDQEYVIQAIAYFNGLGTRVASEIADGLMRFMNRHFLLVAQTEKEWKHFGTAPENTDVLIYDENLKKYTVGRANGLTSGTRWMPLYPPGGHHE